MSTKRRCVRCGATGSGEEIGCREGWPNPAACSYFKASPESPSAPVRAIGSANEHIVPWTGNKLGVDSLSLVAERSPLRILGLVGFPRSGKTTFLLMLYLLLSRGWRLQVGRFAGSLTLEAWEYLARHARQERPEPPHFPPHTPVGRHDEPGLMHLAVRAPSERLQEVVLTDTSGEWFRLWREGPEGDDAAGARWIVNHSHAFLLFIDCARLADPDRIAASRAVLHLQQLVGRLADVAGRRRVAILWAKADMAVPAVLRERVDRVLSDLLPHARHFSLSTESVRHGEVPFRLQDYLDVVDWALGPPAAEHCPLPTGRAGASDYFLLVGSE